MRSITCDRCGVAPGAMCSPDGRSHLQRWIDAWSLGVIERDTLRGAMMRVASISKWALVPMAELPADGEVPTEAACTRCGQPKPGDSNLMHPACEQQEGAEALAALRELAAEQDQAGPGEGTPEVSE
ncbi:MAG TPA: hypothetical protein VMU94_09420 [Streptosporangiaceae bacterium]|nr:hypothetical protein [Streptosporangiaceae bacterium]